MDPLGESTLKLKSHLTTRRQLKAPRPQNTHRSIFHSAFLLSLQRSATFRGYYGLLTKLPSWPSPSLNVKRQESETAFQTHAVKGQNFSIAHLLPREVSLFLRSTLHWFPLFPDMYLKASCSCLSPSFSWLPIREISLVSILKVPGNEHMLVN